MTAFLAFTILWIYAFLISPALCVSKLKNQERITYEAARLAGVLYKPLGSQLREAKQKGVLEFFTAPKRREKRT